LTKLASPGGAGPCCEMRDQAAGGILSQLSEGASGKAPGRIDRIPRLCYTIIAGCGRADHDFISPSTAPALHSAAERWPR
jgi:hypothetical protein